MDQRRYPVVSGQHRRESVKRSKTRHGSRSALVLESLEARHLLAADVIINEIMYHAASGDPGDDWLELHNRGDQPLNLNGYQLTAGVDFTFPDVTLEAGGYLAVAADVDKFSALYPTVTNVVGGWQGKLSNNAENIRLRDDLGNEVDEAFYADSGDFAIRRLVPVPTDLVNFVGACIGSPTLDGWEWFAPHDGEGASLELIQTGFANDFAHNWAASADAGGTPGAANSVAAADIAPTVSEVSHAPALPTSADTVTITARVVDDQTGPVTASLFYRRDGGENEAFIEMPMFDDGQHDDGAANDGVFTATIAPHSNQTIIDFYIVARDDGGLNRTYPPPSDDVGGQETNLLYQVDDREQSAELPLYRTIMTAADRVLYQNQNHRCSDAQRNATLIWSYGGRTETRYNVGIRYRGSDSRPTNPPNQRFNIPSDRPLLGNTQFNIGGNNPDDQIAGSALWALANEPAADAWPVRVLQNGIDLNRNGYFAQVEVLNSDWAQRHFPLDGNGNGYRGRRANEGPPGGRGAGLQYFGEDQLSYVSYLKQTNRSEADWSDVVRLTDALNNTPNETYLEEVGQVLNIDQWLRSIALTEVTGYGEFGLLTGDARGDDWAMYGGVDDPRFVYIPYDLDTMFTGRTGNFLSAENVPALSRLINFPGIFPRLYGHFIDLIDNVLVEDHVRPHLMQLFGGIESEGTINGWINFLQGRGDFIKNSLALELTAESTDAVLGDFPRTTSSTAGLIRGESNVVHTRRVLVSGQEAEWNERNGRWSIVGIPLQPGINRVRVEALDENDQVFESTWVEIFRDAGTTTNASGTLTEDTTWSLAEGPYRVTSELTVAAGATLTIEPGVSVFFDPAARMVVNGRLDAVGTEADQIRFTRTPGTTATWRGLQFRDTQQDNQIHWAVVEWGITNDGMIGLENSRIELDSVTLDNTDRRRIRTIDSSLVVRNSTFTNIFDPGEAPTTDNQSEHIWGRGVPADGEFLIENNFFGHITGHNDGIDFDAPRLPNPIPHIIGNFFAGGGDDALDMTGDVYIAGNTFRNYIKDEFNTDPGESNTISSSGGDFYVLRNVFENVQHASLVKEGAFMYFFHNTVANVETSALYFDLPGETSGPGRGAMVVGSIFENVARGIDVTYMPTGELTVTDSLLPKDELDTWPNNLSGKALLRDVPNGDFTLRDGSSAQGTGPNDLDMGAKVPAGASIAGEPAEVTRATTATLTVNGPGLTHYRYRLNDDPFGEATTIDTPIELTGLVNGTYTVYVIGQDLLGQWQPESEATQSLSWTVDSSRSRLVINEVLASNATHEHQGTFPDMIELFNDGPNIISLAGMSVTDDPTRPTRFIFPNNTSIGPGEYLTLFADDPNGTPGFHLGFNLRRDGEGVYLHDNVINGRALIDSVEFGMQITDLSIGRDRHGEWTLTEPTFGGANQAINLGDPSLLRINEWMTAPDVVFNNDYIEVHNGNPSPVDLGGLFLTDNAFGWPLRHEIAPLSFIDGGGLSLFIADGDPEDGPDHVDFRLSSEMEVIGLFDRDGTRIDSVRYTPQIVDISEGRTPNSALEIAKFPLPNPGLDNPGSEDVEQVPLLGIEDVWKFDDSGTNLGGGWVATNFDDAGWDEGPGLLFVENEPLPAPTNTPLTIGSPTFYFRKTLNLEIDPTQIESLDLTTVIDDGAVIYFNGTEVFRIGMPPSGRITFDTLANRNVNEAQFESFTIPADALVPGENVIAVEVHQTRLNSTDIVFGMAMEARLISPTFSSNNQLLFDHLRITEFNYNPIGGANTEFIEFQNTGPEPINLAGVRLSEGVDFTFPDVTLEPDEYIVIVSDIAGFQAQYGTEIPIAGEFADTLSNNSERLRLQLPAPNEINILDFTYDDDWYPVTDSSGFSLVKIDPLAARNSWSDRLSWRPSNFVNGSPGVTDAGFDTDILVINEVLPNTGPAGSERIELLNTTAGPLNIGGWYVSDSASTLTKYQLPEGTEIPAGGYVVLTEQDDFGAAFTLADHGGQVFLASPDAVGELAGFISSFRYSAVDAGASIGRYTKSDGSIEIVEQAVTTFGNDNSAPRVGPVVINEIHYRPVGDSDEYIELHNTSAAPVSLFDPANPENPYQLSGAVELEFPSGIEIPADGYALVVGIDPDDFRDKHGIPNAVPIIGPYVGTLADTGADIRLSRAGVPDGDLVPQILVEHVDYGIESPWPSLPSGINVSVNRLDPTEFGNDAINWELSIVDGTPGAANVNVDVTPPTTPTDVVATVAAGPQVELSWAAAIDDETDIDLYRIFRDGALLGTSRTTTFVDVDVTAPGSFSYAVSATNTQGLESGLSDASAIQLLGVESLRTSLPTEILLRFSEPVTEASASDPANYAIDGIVTEAVELTPDGRTVKLTTSPLSEGTIYTLVVSNVESMSVGQLPPNLSIRFEFTPGVPGITVRGIQSTESVNNLNQADQLLALPAGDPLIARDETIVYPTVNFLDDDGTEPQGVYADDDLFPIDSLGDNDDFVIQARGLITIPSGGGGEWTFGANLALPDTGSRLALVPFGSTWQYLDDGSDQGTAWTEPDFDDAGWRSGAAQLGYGEGDEATVVGFGDDPSNRFTTTYFRHTFDVPDPSSFILIFLGRAIRDDGIAIYLNGDEIYRNNLADEADYLTFAESTIAGADEDTPIGFTAQRSRFVAGENVLAVELHQAEADSSDLSFDLELTGILTGTTRSDDGFRLRVDGQNVIVADSQHTVDERLGTVSLDEGVHEIELTFFEHTGGAEVELFAAPGSFSQLDQTDTWRLVGDRTGGGLTVQTEPPPPTPIEWSRAKPLGSLLYEFAQTTTISEAGFAFGSEFSAGQVLSVAANPLGDSSLSFEIRGDDGTVAVATSTGAGHSVALSNVVIPRTGSYVVRFETDAETDVNLLMAVDASFEDEQYLNGARNDSPLTAGDLGAGLVEISQGITRSAVYGVTDGFQQRVSESGTLFAPNVLTFDFDPPPLLGPTPAQLVIRAQGDLNGGAEFLTIDAEGLLQQDIFMDDGINTGSFAELELSPELVSDLAADGVITISVTPSSGVDDQGFSQIELILQVGEPTQDHYQIALADGDAISVVLSSLSGGDLNLDVVDEAGTLIVGGIQASGADRGEFIRNFLAPTDGTYFFRVSGERQQPYRLLVVDNAEVDLGFNDTIDTAGDITFYGAAIGGLGGVGAGSVPGGGDVTPVVLPINLTDGAGFLWDIQPDGNINNGTSDAYDGGLFHQNFGFFFEGLSEDEGREIVLGPTPLGNIELNRKIYVPDGEGYARFLEIVTNNGPAAETYTITMFTNLGSDDGTNLIGTSSGDNVFSAEDNWIVTDDQDGQNDPSMTHVIAGTGRTRPQLANSNFDNINFTYQLELAPGETQIVMHFAAQSNNRAEALEKAVALENLELDALSGMSPEELSQLVNFASEDIVDHFALRLAAGDSLHIVTETPVPGVSSVLNDLDPVVELVDANGQVVALDDNSAADGRNVDLRFDAVADGTYTVRVTSANGSGEYLLRASGNTIVPLPLTVVSTEPVDDARLKVVPTAFRVNFAAPFDSTTLDPEDLTINDQPAIGVQVVDGDTVDFLLDPMLVGAGGDFTVDMEVNVISGLAGGSNEPFQSTFFVDAVAPRVASTLWNAEPLSEDRTLPGGTPLLFTATFDEPLDPTFLDESDVSIFNTTTFETRTPLGIFYDEMTDTFTASFAVLPEGEYTLVLTSGDEAFEDQVGNDLDGEALGEGVDGTPTGDGVEGGNYAFTLIVDSPVRDLDSSMDRIEPFGSLVYGALFPEAVSYNGDLESYSLALGAGEVLDVSLVPRQSQMSMTLRVIDEAGAIVQEITGDPGQPVQVTSQRITTSGRYLIEATGDIIGDEYDILIARNAGFELNDTTATSPLVLEDTRLDLDADRMAAIGQADLFNPEVLVWGVQPASGQILILDPVNGTRIRQFPAPDALAAGHTRIGLAMADFGNTLLYLNADVDPTQIYRLDPEDGSVLSAETVATGDYDGLGFIDGNLFLSNRDGDVRRQAGFSGPVTEGWATGSPVGAIGGDNFGRVFGVFADGMIHEFDPEVDDNAFLSTILAPADDIEGLAFDTEFLYASTASGQLYTIDTDPDAAGVVRTVIPVEGGPLFGLAAHTPKGLATGTIIELEPNNVIGEAQPIDGEFFLEFHPNIHDTQGNTSETIPHVTVFGTGDNTFDFYSFSASAGSRAIFDIDTTENLDSYLRLYDANGNSIAENDDTFFGGEDPGSNTGLDSFLEFTFNTTGQYFIEVGSCCVGTVDNGGTYQLHVSIENHSTGTVLVETADTLIETGSIWRYLDDGSDQGTAWQAPGFDDGSWSEGAAQLGYGDGDETTTVGFGPNPDNKFVTTYFRHSFEVDNPGRFSDMTLELLRDDGAAVYLNGAEIARDNLPANATFDTMAQRTINGAAERVLQVFNVDPGLLVNGANVLAVEIHQADADSSDISFDLRMVARTSSEAATLPPIPDVDFYRLDLPEETPVPLDITLTAIDGEDEPLMSLELIGPDGTTVVATGVSDLAPETSAENLDLGIFDFVPAEAGDYTVRVTSGSDIFYHLYVTQGVLAEVEPNNELTDPIRSLDDVTGVYGFLPTGGGTSSADDAEGDAIAGTGVAPDLATVSGTVQGDVLILRMDLHNTIQLDAGWFGYFELDLDQNAATGDPSFQSALAPPGQQGGDLGIERRVIVGTQAVAGGVAVIFDSAFNPVGQAPLTVGANFFLAEVPLSILNDDGNTNFGTIAGVIGDQFVRDAAPNTTFVTVSTGGIVDGPGDLYEITLAAGESIKLTTQTPLDDLGDIPVNQLDPALELLDPNGEVVADDMNSAADERNAELNYTATEAGVYTVRVFAEDRGGEYLLLLLPPDSDQPRVVGRSIFYNNSAFDGNDPAASDDDDTAIAADKTALLPGQTATFANYTSYARGINGIMIDVDQLAGEPTLDDFEFRVGNDDQPENWPMAPAPSTLLVRPSAGEGEPSRIVLIWDDNVIEKQWLQVTVLATERTGLTQPDVFYFGNAVGDSGNSEADAKVNATDEVGARNNTHTLLDPAPIDDAYDYNRDQRVDATDEIIARNNSTTFVNELRLITAPAAKLALKGDFNGDGQLGQADIDMLASATAAGSDDASFDLDEDGFVSYGDIETWVVGLFGSSLGDADLNGVVDGQDFIIWSDHRYEPGGLWSQADFNGDGWVDGLDFNLWNDSRFRDPLDPVQAQTAARVPRAALSVELTPGIPVFPPTSSHSVQTRPLETDSLTWRSLDDLIWAAWPTQQAFSAEGEDSFLQSTSIRWRSDAILHAVASRQRHDVGFEDPDKDEEITALDAFFARRRT